MTSLNWVINLENKFQKSFILFFCCIAILLIGFIDLVTAQKISLYVLYSIPIFAGSWLIGPAAGFFLCIGAVFGWMIVDLQLRANDWSFFLWNAGLRLCFFFGISYVLSSLKLTLEREKRWAQIDFLTELPNRRSFLTIANQERERAIRHRNPLTVAYIDLDNFKQINDFSGHDVGDVLLKEIALILKSNIRKSDTVARIGGDEFILLLPQTGFEDGETLLHKLIDELRKRMDEKKSKITISIGAVTFLDSFPEVLSMIVKADELMYSAKAEGKNRILHTKYE